MIENKKLYNGHTYSGALLQACIDGYKQGRAETYIECMRIVSECVWKDSEMLEKMLAEQMKEQTDERI